MSVVLALHAPSPSGALIFADESTEPEQTVPPDFPYWEHVTQRRYDGPSVIYLGAGWALTARHVGRGEIWLDGRIIPPTRFERHTLLNLDGSTADALVFALDPEADLPDMPLLPIATRPPEVGEQVLLIGFGRLRGDRFEWGGHSDRKMGLSWTERGEKRWGTNRVTARGEWLPQDRWQTRVLAMRFDPPDHVDATPHEVSAATGDSGGALFVRRDGEWQLAGLITSIASQLAGKPSHSTAYGDFVYAADLSFYREEILRWARPACANGEDDDGDGAIDHPEDPDCRSPLQGDERPIRRDWRLAGGGALAALIGIGLAGALAWRRQRGRRTPASTSPSTAD